MPGLRAPGDRVELTLESVAQTTALYSLYTALGDPLSGTIYATDSSNNTVTATIVTDPGTGVMTAEFTSLNPATTYSIPPQAVTGSDAGIQSTYTFTTLDVPQKLYGSVNGNAKRVRKLYGPISQTNVTAINGVIHASAGNLVSFDGGVFLTYMNANFPTYVKPVMDSIVVSFDGLMHRAEVRLYNSDSTQVTLGTNLSVSDVATMGITTVAAGNIAAGIDSIKLSVVSVTVSVAKRIAKLYGSVNGSAKLIYEDPNA